MNPQELLRIVDSLHREKQISPDLVISAIESALVTAAKRQFGEEADVLVKIAPEGGQISATVHGKALSQDEIGRSKSLFKNSRKPSEMRGLMSFTRK